MTTATEPGINPKDEVCCPPLDVSKWDGTTIEWKEKLFVKDHVTSVLHIPLNYGGVVTRVLSKIEGAGAQNDDGLMLSDERSAWGSDLYVATSKAVPAAEIAKLSGTYLTKVFEGNFSQVGQWADDMATYAKEQGKEIAKLYFWYTTCPKCAKKYGKNYVVLFAQIA